MTVSWVFTSSAMRPVPTPAPLGAGTLMDQVLLVYNSASAASQAVAQYYVANRPGAAKVDILAINTLTTEQISFAQMNSDIKAPIVAWLAANPSRLKRYIVLCLGIPTRTTSGPSGVNTSVAYAVSTTRTDSNIGSGGPCVSEYAGTGGSSGTGMLFYGGDGGPWGVHFPNVAYPNTRALVMNLCMGNSQAAVQAYIDKLATMYAAMAKPDVVISARNASLAGSNWYFDDTGASSSLQLAQSPHHYMTIFDPTLFPLDGVGLPLGNAFYADVPGPHLLSGSDLAAYCGWGTNGGLGGSYPTAQLSFTGKSNWYLVSTFESFNGQAGTGQGSYVKWWDPVVLGGSASSRTPIGMCCHTEEPFTPGCTGETFFRNWLRGFNLAESAWAGRDIQFFMAVGDPLVVW